MREAKIGTVQALLLLLLSRIVSLLAAAPLSRQGEIGGGMTLVALLLSYGMVILLFLPGFWLLCRHPGADYAQALTMELGRGAAFFLWLVLTVQAGLTAAEFERFLLTAVYTDAPETVFALLFLGAAVFGVCAGLEAFARFTTFCGTLFFLLTAGLFFRLWQDIRLTELFAAPMPTLPVFLGTSWSFVSGCMELPCFFLLLSHLRMETRKGKGLFLIWNTLYLFLAGALLFLVTCVLGGSAEQGREYPFYTLAMAAEGTLLTRMDALHMSVWSVLGLLRCMLMLWGADKALRCARSLPGERGTRIALTTVGAAVTLLLLRFPDVYRSVRYLWREGILLVILLVLFPAAVFLMRLGRNLIERRKRV